MALVFLYLSQFFFRDILINLFTDSVSILVTLFYVNWIFQLEERKKWRIPQQRIIFECGKVGQGYITAIIAGLKLEDKINPNFDLNKFSIREFQQEKNIRVKNLSKKEIAYSLANFDCEKWILFIDEIRKLKQKVESTINRYSAKLDPKEISLLFELEDISEDIMINFSLYEYYLKKPLTQKSNIMNKNNYDYNIIGIKFLSIDIKRALETALRLIAIFNYQTNHPKTDYIKEIENFD